MGLEQDPEPRRQISVHGARNEIALPGWLRALLPNEIEASAIAQGGKRIRLRLRFPRGLSLTLELVPAEEAGPGEPWAGKEFVLRYTDEGNASQEQRVRACRFIGSRLQLDEPRVLSFMEHASRLSQLATGKEDESWWSGEPSHRGPFLLHRALGRMRADDAAAARDLLDTSSDPDTETTLPITALLRLSLAEPLRAMALRSERPDGDERPVALLVRGMAAALVGDPERARDACQRLAELSRTGEGSVDYDLLSLAGSLANASKQYELAFACLGEPAKKRGLPSDRARAMMALVNRGDEATFAAMARELLEEMRASAGVANGFGLLCEHAGQYDLAASAYELLAESADPSERLAARVALAKFAVWRLNVGEARKRLETLGTSEEPNEAVRLRATVAHLEGAPAEALEILDALEAKAPESAGDAEQQLVRAEALLALGRFDEALEAVARAQQSFNSFANFAVRARILARKQLVAEGAGLREDGTCSVFPSEFSELLVSEIAPETLERAKRDPQAAVELLGEIARRMGGNRGQSPTRLLEQPEGPAKIVRWVLPENARQAASSLLRRLWWEEPAEVLRRFEEIAERFPRSPFPFTYGGELRLWLGDYSGAISDFETALRRKPTRWAYVGIAAAHMFLGDARLSNRVSAEGIERFGELASSTTHVYRGELRRREGDFEGALADLELAVGQRPSRVAARMNLALAYSELRRHADAERELRRAISEVPGIVANAAESLGVPLPEGLDMATARPLIERALELMRGNRSSWLYSMFDRRGRFCVLPSVSEFVELSRQNLWVAEPAIWEALAQPPSTGRS